MKLFGWLIVALVAVSIGSAAGARWIGQQGQDAATFPLPGEDGCWNGLCFSVMPPEDVLAGLRAGDALAALGPPDRVSLLVDQVSLTYTTRRLDVLILPSSIDLDQARLLPGDAVIGLFVTNQDSLRPTESVYYPPSSPWQGFGTIRFRTLP